MIGTALPSNRARSRARTGKSAGAIINAVSVSVDEPPHLCRVQAATRELCRSIGLDEGDVFSAVIAVTELAHRRFIEASRAGVVNLSVVRGRNGLSMEIRAKCAGAGAPAIARMTFPVLEERLES